MMQLPLAAAAVTLFSVAPAFSFGMPLCRDAEGLFADKTAAGWTTRFLGTSDGGRATYLSMTLDGKFEVIAGPLPGLACLILSGSLGDPSAPVVPELLEQSEG